MMRFVWLCLALLLLHATPVLAAAKIEVSLDRNPVPLNESFTLIFSASESPDDDPDFSPLEKDFEVMGQTQSNQFSFKNGQSARSIEWRLTVMAKRAGTLDVPPVAFGSDHSEPFSVTIIQGAAGRGAAADEDVLLEVDAEPKNPYVQAQVIYTVRVFSRFQMGQARLAGPEAADALIQQLNGEQQSIATRNGVQYRLTEVRYALFPQKSGKLRIEPTRLDAQIPVAGRSGFNPFFNRSRSQRLQSEPVELEVRPVPPEFAGKHWLPAASLALEDSWAQKPPQTTSGEPITRTLTLKAEGATVGLLPELNPASAPDSGDIKQYPDQPTQNEEKRQDGLASARQEKTALIASKPGTYRLPAVEIPWWNTKTDRMETAKLPERILTVLPSAHSPSPEPAPPAPEAVSETQPPPSVPVEAKSPEAVSATGAGLWFWLALLFGLGWLGTALAWWLSRRPRVNEDAEPSAAIQPERQWVEAVERACRANDPTAARRALLGWASQRWPEAGTGALERFCGGPLGREIDR
ncbi:BatD family protein, partial [Methylomagnum sp.]